MGAAVPDSRRKDVVLLKLVWKDVLIVSAGSVKDSISQTANSDNPLSSILRLNHPALCPAEPLL
jgi:hypothetical protein